MNEDKSFIVINRKILEWEWYGDSNTKDLFIHLLLIANWEDKNWKGIEVKRGSLITSVKHLSEQTKLTVRQVRTSLDKLILTNEITKSTTNKYTVITINNYNKYQDYDKQNGKQTANKRQTNDKQMTTTKQYNNITNNISSSNIYDFIEKNLGRTLSPIEYEKIKDWNDCELTRYAIKKAVLNGKYSIGYINGILNNYKKNNIVTVQQAQNEEQEYKKNKNNKTTKKENAFMKVLKGVDDGTIILK